MSKEEQSQPDDLVPLLDVNQAEADAEPGADGVPASSVNRDERLWHLDPDGVAVRRKLSV